RVALARAGVADVGFEGVRRDLVGLRFVTGLTQAGPKLRSRSRDRRLRRRQIHGRCSNKYNHRILSPETDEICHQDDSFFVRLEALIAPPKWLTRSPPVSTSWRRRSAT